MTGPWHWIVHWTGCDYGAGYGHFQPYDFLSGFGSLSLFAWLIGMYVRHRCHGCWRLSRHVVDGSPWCNRHHETARSRMTGPAGT